MKYLALDIGTKRTGVAFADTETGVPVSLETLTHDSFEKLLNQVMEIISARQINEVVLGLPRRLGGSEGAQASKVRDFAELLEDEAIACSFVDERYTSTQNREIDKDSAAAVLILGIKLAQL